MRQNCDLEYYQNNGVTAIRPTETGCLASLVKKTKTHEPKHGEWEGHQRVWIFCDVDLWQDKDGDERVNHHHLGVRNGTYEEGRAFLMMCHELGLSAESVGFFVPFSNGESRHALMGQVATRYERSLTTDGQPLSDYEDSELKLMRCDLPTRAQLASLVGSVDRQ